MGESSAGINASPTDLSLLNSACIYVSSIFKDMYLQEMKVDLGDVV